jgi:hypothetical protein
MGATYQLAHPIVRKLRVAGGSENEETIAEVEIRRINGGDIRWMEGQGSKAGTSLGLVSRVTGMHTSVVDLLDAEDIAGIAEVIEGFLPPSLRSGETSSGT